MVINVFVSAKSPANVDSGNFKLIIGPNLGANNAGRNFGRFAHLLDNEGAELFEEINSSEGKFKNNVIYAGLCASSSTQRLSNVMLTPRFYKHEIHTNSFLILDNMQIIPLSEIVVGIENNTYYLRSKEMVETIKIRNWHVVNMEATNPIAEFLSSIAYDGEVMLSHFSWGLAENFPYLPRVEYKNIILRLAEWKIDFSTKLRKFNFSSRTEKIESLSKWRREWSVPSRVFLSYGDNRLLINFDSSLSCDEFIKEIEKIEMGGILILQEQIPDFEHCWVNDKNGNRFFSEFIIPLVSKRETNIEYQNTNRLYKKHSRCKDDLLPPAINCLYIKLYAFTCIHDELISQYFKNFCEELLSKKVITHWFFIRYSDPKPHLRLRLFLSEGRGEIIGHACDFANGLFQSDIIWHYSFDTYTRETERYGGVLGLNLTEKYFYYETLLVVDLLNLVQAGQLDFELDIILILTIDIILDLFLVDKISWLDNIVSRKYEFTAEYRQQRNYIRKLFQKYHNNALPELNATIVNFIKNTETIAQRFHELSINNELTIPLEKILVSFCHMHFNRVMGIDSNLERKTIEFLSRINKELVAYPLNTS